MSSIRLHPEHGVNPSLDVCFWCGEPRGVALLGFNKGRAAPRQIITSYEPCDTCKGNMAKGVTLVEVVESSRAGQPEIAPGKTPTGRWAVMKDDAVMRLFNEPFASAALKARKAFVDEELMDTLAGAPDDGAVH